MKAQTSPRPGLRAILLAAIVVLYLLSVPWYRDADAPLRVWLGLPDWVAVALACYVAVAILNAVAWLLTDVDDEAAADASAIEGAGRLDPSAGPRDPASPSDPASPRSTG